MRKSLRAKAKPVYYAHINVIRMRASAFIGFWEVFLAEKKRVTYPVLVDFLGPLWYAPLPLESSNSGFERRGHFS